MSKGWIRTSVGGFYLDVAWEVAPGEVLVVYGSSGAGKTLMLRAIAGLLKVHKGYIQVGGTVVFDERHDYWLPAHMRNIGYVPQNYSLFPHLSVKKNISYGLFDLTPTQVDHRVDRLLKKFNLVDLKDQLPHHLSGGEQQRVALARALAPEPKLLLLDEPFSALDIQTRRHLRSELSNLLSFSNVPIILVTHDHDDALVLGDCILVIDSGRVIGQGDPLELLGRPSSLIFASLIGIENLYKGFVLSRSTYNGTMLCKIQNITLEVPIAEVAEGDIVNIGVRARDVLIATSYPHGLSARNLIPGEVISLEMDSNGIEVSIDVGVLVRSRVTQEAVRDLHLGSGTKVWVIIKASSCFLVDGRAR